MNYIPFKIESKFSPTGDQPRAIKQLCEGLKNDKRVQVLLGATGTGKTFTMANIIQEVQRPALILVHNKTLASQLYAEFKELFPNNRVKSAFAIFLLPNIYLHYENNLIFPIILAELYDKHVLLYQN